MIQKQRYTLDNVLSNRYYQMPKFLFEDEFKSLSNDARILYALLKDRHELSVQNGWVNEKNEVYFIYTREEMQDVLSLSDKTVTKAIRELKEFGLLEEERQGRGRANRIYLSTVSVQEFKSRKISESRTGKFTTLEPENFRPNNTNINKTDNNDLSINQEKTKEQRREEESKKKDDGLIDNISIKNKSEDFPVNPVNDSLVNYSLEYIREQLEIDILEQEDKMYSELAELIFDVVNEKQKTIRVNKVDMQTEVVISRMLKLTSGHLQYVVENFKMQTIKIKNVRSYLITALYNSYTSISGHYSNQIQQDVV